MCSKSKKSLSLILFALLGAARAEATQVIEDSHKKHVQVNVSAAETNRLSIEGRRIANVVPAQPGLISAKKDEAQGALYFTMTPDRQALGTVTMFVSDDQNTTYKVVIVPRAIPGEDIVIRPPAAAAPSTDSVTGRAPSHQRRANELILAMSGPDDAAAVAEMVPVNKEVSLWQEARLVLAAKYLSRDIVGEKYRLTNVSGADMLLVEQELYRRGVRAVSISHHTLAPGDSADIYIVRERKDHE